MRANEFITIKQHLSELAPLMPRNNSVAQARRGTVQTGSSMSTIKSSGTVGPNQTVGTQPRSQSGMTTPTTPTPANGGVKQQVSNQGTVTQAEIELDKAIAPGKIIPLPTASGTPTNFKITRVTGNEVEIKNPLGAKDPSQPNKLTYSRDDLKKSIVI